MGRMLHHDSWFAINSCIWSPPSGFIHCKPMQVFPGICKCTQSWWRTIDGAATRSFYHDVIALLELLQSDNCSICCGIHCSPWFLHHGEHYPYNWINRRSGTASKPSPAASQGCCSRLMSGNSPSGSVINRVASANDIERSSTAL